MKPLHSKPIQASGSVYLKIALSFLFLISFFFSNAQKSHLHHLGFYIKYDSSEVAFWAPVHKDVQLLYSHFNPGSINSTDDLLVSLLCDLTEKSPSNDTNLAYLYENGHDSTVERLSVGQNEGKHSQFFNGTLIYTLIDTYSFSVTTVTLLPLPYWYGDIHTKVDSLYQIFYVVAPADLSPNVRQAYCVVNFPAYKSDKVDSISFRSGEVGNPDTFTVHVRTKENLDSLPAPKPDTVFVAISSRQKLLNYDKPSFITEIEVQYVKNDSLQGKKKVLSPIPIRSYDDPDSCIDHPSSAGPINKKVSGRNISGEAHNSNTCSECQKKGNCMHRKKRRHVK